MKNAFRQFLYFILICGAILFSCATTSTAPPDWITNGVASVYPRESYIAVEGNGSTAKLAEQDAYAALSRYFIAEITSSAYSRETWASDTGLNAQTYDETFVHSAMRLFALRRTTPWYDPHEKTYTSVAYIDRAEAWEIFEPQVRKEADEFHALWRVAESESAALKSYFDYKRAQEYTQRDDFTNTMNFGAALYPQNMNALTAGVRENATQLGAKLNEARSMARIFIDCPVDFDSSIATALAKLLSAEGLPVTADKRMAAAVCAATVDEGFQRVEGTGDFYYPKINVIITDISGNALFSYSTSVGKQAAINAEVAKRRAYSALAAILESNFSGELNRKFSVKQH